MFVGASNVLISGGSQWLRIAVATHVITFQPPLYRVYYSAPGRLDVADVTSAGAARQRGVVSRSGVELVLRDGATVYFWPFDRKWRSDATGPSVKVSRLLALLGDAGVPIRPGEHAVGLFVRRCRSPLVADAEVRRSVLVAAALVVVVITLVVVSALSAESLQ